MPRLTSRQPLPTSSPAFAISPGGLLADAFPGPSWDRWRAVLKAAYALPLNATELALFREVAERDPPSHRVKELWAIVGRRGGKDSIASAIATCAALSDYRQLLRPGERAVVMCLAVDRDQARIVHRYVAGYFSENPLLRPLIAHETDDGLELTNSVDVVVATNSYRAVRGRTIVAAIFDEAAFWRDETSANPADETYNAIVPGLATLPGSMLIGISTPYRRTGLLFDKFAAHYGQNDDDVLVVRGASRLFNPTLPQSVIDAALARDPEAAASEWLAEWRSDLSDFLDRALVEAAIDSGAVIRPYNGRQAHVAFVDPSGGRGDSFTAAIAHAEGDKAFLDCLFERRPPFDSASVVEEIAALLHDYHIARVTGDNYAAGWVSDAFAKQAIRYEKSERDRSAIYLDALPLFTAGRARLLDNPRLTHQLISLERRTNRGGKDRVDHPPGSHDDLANAATGALVLASTDGAAIWRKPWAIAKPGALDSLFGVSGHGGSAVLRAQQPSRHGLRFK